MKKKQKEVLIPLLVLQKVINRSERHQYREIVLGDESRIAQKADYSDVKMKRKAGHSSGRQGAIMMAGHCRPRIYLEDRGRS